MSLAAQTSDIVNALAQTRELRRQALGHIRSETARHLRDARVSHRRMAESQQQQLAEAVRGTKLATAILLGAADEAIDSYRKTRLREAAALDRALSEGFATLRKDTRKWRDAEFALRRRQASEDLRERRRARAALQKDVQSLTAQNLAFLGALTADRQQASAIWQGRSAVLDLAPIGAAPAAPAIIAAPATAPAAPVIPAPAAEPAPVEAAIPAPSPVEPAKVEAKAPEVKAPEAKAADTKAPEAKATEPKEGKEAKESKSSAGKSGERGDHGKSA